MRDRVPPPVHLAGGTAGIDAGAGPRGATGLTSGRALRIFDGIVDRCGHLPYRCLPAPTVTALPIRPHGPYSEAVGRKALSFGNTVGQTGNERTTPNLSTTHRALSQLATPSSRASRPCQLVIGERLLVGPGQGHQGKPPDLSSRRHPRMVNRCTQERAPGFVTSR